MAAAQDATGVKNEVYLGDGVHASFDGFCFILRAPRAGGGRDQSIWDRNHWVAMEPLVLLAFDAFRAKIKAEHEAKTK